MEETMSYRSWQEFVRRQRTRYRRATRAGKSRILTEACEVFGVHRKSLIRAFARTARCPGKPRGRKPRYGPEVATHLTRLWLACGQLCSKRLKEALPLWLPAYERRYGVLPDMVREALLHMSPSTMDRVFKPIRARRRKGLCATRPSHLQGQIPIRTCFHKVDGPGWVEVDTVAHCGQSLAGRFVWSLAITDIWSGWTENRAVWNRSSAQIVQRMEQIEAVLPFELLGFDSDNGSEFLNLRLLRYLHERPTPVSFTRSRPYRKNDNAHVEQKQWTHVRQLLGYDRFEDRRLVTMINDLFAGEWRLMVNFFWPSMQLVSKSRQRGHISRRHTKPRTPCQRLLDCHSIDQEIKQQLARLQKELDPFQLQKEIQRKLKDIFRLVRKQKIKIPKTQKAA